MIAWFLYFSMNSSAPEKAIWLMYLSTSSAVMPMPRSVTVSVFALHFADRREGLQFLGCVDCIGDQLAQENLMV